MMNDCKDCRHYRPDDTFFWPSLQHRFAKCDHPSALSCSFARIERKYDIACGSEGHWFEPIPLGRSHGIDWDRAAKMAATLAEMREFCAKHPGAEIQIVKRRPVLSMKLLVKISSRRRFTVAEYLAALTTDYCAADAAAE